MGKFKQCTLIALALVALLVLSSINRAENKPGFCCPFSLRQNNAAENNNR